LFKKKGFELKVKLIGEERASRGEESDIGLSESVCHIGLNCDDQVAYSSEQVYFIDTV